MNIVGPGVREIWVRDASGAFRVIYVTKQADAIYVLHCFHKKSAKTSKGDIDIARRRHKQLLKELNE